MTDVRQFQTDDGGEITYVNGQAELDDGLEAAAYLSLFGGNERDTGGDATKHLEWWGNKTEPEEVRHYRSELQSLLRSIPAIPSNLRRIEDAANRDLAWMTETGLATFVGVEATIPKVNTIKIDGRIEIGDDVFPFDFTATGRDLNQD